MNIYTHIPGPKPKAPTTPLGVRLQALRLERGWSMGKLAAKAGLSVSAVKTAERGTHEPTLFTAICLADALGVTLDYLTTGRKGK